MEISCPCIVVLCLAAVVPATHAAPPGTGFQPELVGVELTSNEVQPGDVFAITLKFRNGGNKPAPDS